VSGFASGFGGSTNNQGGGAGGFEVGVKDWRIWGSGGGQRTGDYNTPLGVIDNSPRPGVEFDGRLRMGKRPRLLRHGIPLRRGALRGAVRRRVSWAAGTTIMTMTITIPITKRAGAGPLFSARALSRARNAEDDHDDHDDDEDREDISLAFRRHNLRVSAGAQGIGTFIDGVRFSLNYSDWEHRELEEDRVATLFNNKTFVYRGVFEQQRLGPWLGTFGFQGLHRDYEVTGRRSAGAAGQTGRHRAVRSAGVGFRADALSARWAPGA
jgi:iron complex outermembrane recepter protein